MHPYVCITLSGVLTGIEIFSFTLAAKVDFMSFSKAFVILTCPCFAKLWQERIKEVDKHSYFQNIYDYESQVPG